MDPRSLIVLALFTASAQPSDTESFKSLEQVLKSRSDDFGAYANDFTKQYEPIAYAALPLHKPMPVIAILSDKPLTQYAASYKQHSFSKPDQEDYVETEYQTSKENSDEDKVLTASEFQKLFSKYLKPNADSAEYQIPYAKYQEPFAKFGQKLYPGYEKPYTGYQLPYSKYWKQLAESQKQLAEHQKQLVEYQKLRNEYQKPYVVEYPKYTSMEYVKPYPEEPRAYASADHVKPYPPVEYMPVYDRIKPYSSAEAPTILYARPTESGGYTYHRRPQKKRNVRRPRKQKPVILRVHKYKVIKSRTSYPEVDF